MTLLETGIFFNRTNFLSGTILIDFAVMIMQEVRLSALVKCSLLRCIQLFATPWTVALQGSSVRGIIQARIQERVVIPLQGIFPTQGSNQVSCIASRVFTIWATRETHQPWCIMSIGLTSSHVSAIDQPLHGVTQPAKVQPGVSSVNVGNYCHEAILDQWI